MKKSKVAIIGGGSSGLFLASLLNESNAQVFLLEKNNKLGKKILASGNGKCNFTNIFDYKDKYNNEFANKIIETFNVDETLNVFKKYGLIYKNDDQGRCYPVSECSSSVLDVLKRNLTNTTILLDTEVTKIISNGDSYIVEYNNEQNIFDYVACCSGSNASNLGSDKAYNYLKNIVEISDLKPSLVPVIVKQNISSLQGVRAKCKMNLLADGKLCYCENGEVLFKKDSLSGIAIFNASSVMNRKKANYTISLDLCSELSKQELFEYLNERKKYKYHLFKGFLNDKIADYIFNCVNYKGEDIDEKIINKLIDCIANLSFEIVDFYPIKEAQVCSGGVLINQINENLEFKAYPNLYIAGELLNIDGVCGGYNMQFAWSCAGVIARSILKKQGVFNEK